MNTTTLDQAQETVPGLVVFRLAPDHKPNSPHRWRIGHKASGLAIADSMQHENALKGAVDPTDLFVKLSYVWCIEPGSQPLGPGTDASRNGTYTDADIESAAAEFKADGYNALEVLIAMTHSVPWMGLDTEPFNEAHNRIVEASGAN